MKQVLTAWAVFRKGKLFAMFKHKSTAEFYAVEDWGETVRKVKVTVGGRW